MGVYNNFIIQQGATFEQIIVWKDSAGYPVNLTGYDAKLQIANKHTELVVINVWIDGIYNDPASGRIPLYLNPNQTGNIEPGTYVYEIELWYNNDRYRILEGEILVTKDRISE